MTNTNIKDNTTNNSNNNNNIELDLNKLREDYNYHNLLNITNPNENINILDKINCDYYDSEQFLHLIKSLPKKQFSILHTNISSLKANHDNLTTLIYNIQHKFDIISLTETWNGNSNDTFLPTSVNGYQDFIGKPGTSMKSGCGFYIKKDINYLNRTKLDEHYYDGKNEFTAKWIEIVNKQGKNFIIASIYRHPGSADTKFLEYIEKTLLTIKK